MSVRDVDMKVEVIVIPVSDVDRAKEFYGRLGWRLDVTPPIVVQFSPDGPVSGPDPEHRSYFSRAVFRDPDGNEWLLQEITTRLPGRVDAATTSFGSVSDLASAFRRAAAAHGEHEKRTGERDEAWPSWYAAYMVAEQAGTELPTRLRRDRSRWWGTRRALCCGVGGARAAGRRRRAGAGRWRVLLLGRVAGIGLEKVGVEADPRGIHVDEFLRAGERLWAIGDVTGIWPLTHVGEYEGDVVAANIAGDRHRANYEAVPRVTYTDPQAAAVGATEAAYSATACSIGS